MVIGQVGVISCWVIAVLQLGGELTAVLKPETVKTKVRTAAGLLLPAPPRWREYNRSLQEGT